MAHVQWDPRYSVNVKLIDDQHKNLIEMINKAYDILEHKLPSSQLSSLITQISDYMVYHFTTEEKYFLEFHYGDAQEHMKEHNDFTVKVNDIQVRFSQQTLDITDDIIDFLLNWLEHHVIELDKKYTQCFNEHGLI